MKKISIIIVAIVAISAMVAWGEESGEQFDGRPYHSPALTREMREATMPHEIKFEKINNDCFEEQLRIGTINMRINYNYITPYTDGTFGYWFKVPCPKKHPSIPQYDFKRVTYSERLSFNITEEEQVKLEQDYVNQAIRENPGWELCHFFSKPPELSGAKFVSGTTMPYLNTVWEIIIYLKKEQ